MPEHPHQLGFNVQLFAIVRLGVPEVTAASHREAVSMAIERTDLEMRFAGSDGEFAGEFSHYLVEVSGDDLDEESQWFHSRDNPLLSNLARLISWHDRGRPGDELQLIIRDARDILTHSI